MDISSFTKNQISLETSDFFERWSLFEYAFCPLYSWFDVVKRVGVCRSWLGHLRKGDDEHNQVIVGELDSQSILKYYKSQPNENRINKLCVL